MLTALFGSEPGAVDVLVATSKQDFRDSSNLSAPALMAVEGLPPYAYTSHANAAAPLAKLDNAGAGSSLLLGERR